MDNAGAEPNKIATLVRPFDPTSEGAEDQYDTVVRRLNRSRARRTAIGREYDELERQFVENDLTVQSGPNRGMPLTKVGRKKRIQRLTLLAAQIERLSDEEQFAAAELDRMNNALDRWARDTYGAPCEAP